MWADRKREKLMRILKIIFVLIVLAIPAYFLNVFGYWIVFVGAFWFGCIYASFQPIPWKLIKRKIQQLRKKMKKKVKKKRKKRYLKIPLPF